MIVGQGPFALSVGAGGGYLDIFTLCYLFSSFSLSLGGGPIRLKYCLKGPLNPNNQPNNSAKNKNHSFKYLRAVKC